MWTDVIVDRLSLEHVNKDRYARTRNIIKSMYKNGDLKIYSRKDDCFVFFNYSETVPK